MEFSKLDNHHMWPTLIGLVSITTKVTKPHPNPQAAAFLPEWQIAISPINWHRKVIHRVSSPVNAFKSCIALSGYPWYQGSRGKHEVVLGPVGPLVGIMWASWTLLSGMGNFRVQVSFHYYCCHWDQTNPGCSQLMILWFYGFENYLGQRLTKFDCSSLEMDDWWSCKYCLTFETYKVWV